MKMLNHLVHLSTVALLALAAAPTLATAADDAPAAAASMSPEGYWRTIDDETHKPKSIVNIYTQDGKLYGKIVKLFRAPTEEQAPLCDKCTDELKDKPVIGMRILWDLVQDGGEWTGGHILDPNNGKIYKSKLEVVEGGGQLEMRGYIGFSLIGRTQTWERVAKP